MLTQDERDRLARWMGWELRPIGEGATAKAWHDGADYVMLPEHWNPDTGWDDAGMLLDTLAGRGNNPRLYIGYDGCARCCAIDSAIGNEDYIFTGREDEWPAAIAKAVLAMLEAGE